jgi:hypothetical protein
MQKHQHFSFVLNAGYGDIRRVRDGRETRKTVAVRSDFVVAGASHLFLAGSYLGTAYLLCGRCRHSNMLLPIVCK